MIGLLQRIFGRHAPRLIPETLWQQVIAELPFLDGLTDDEFRRLRELCETFLAEKEFNAAGNAEHFLLDDRICLSIAVQGCLPILNLGLDWYRGWHGIIVYPDEFVIPREIIDDDGVVHRYEEVAAGEAWGGGPLILSWTDAQMTDGEYNVVIHEFAHKIDMLNGEPDGCPPLQKNMSNATWRTIWQEAFEDFCHRVDHAPAITDHDEHGEPFEDIALDSCIDPYAAEAPAEFFAVASEVFFTAPLALKAEYPAVYGQLTLFYQQDPGSRITAPNA